MNDPRDGITLTPRMQAILRIARRAPGGRVRLDGLEIHTGRALERRGLGEMNGCPVAPAFLINAEGRRA